LVKKLKPLPTEAGEYGQARMAIRHIHDVGSEVSTFAYRSGGGVSLRSSNLQRIFATYIPLRNMV